jgi:hypothetical protein
MVRDSANAALLDANEPDAPPGMAAMVELAASVGDLRKAITEGGTGVLRGPKVPWEACHPVPIRAGAIATAAGTVDIPDLLGPHDPYWWDVRRIGAWGFTAGTLTLFLNSAQGEQLAAWSAPGNFTWGTSLLLAPRDRLVFVAAGLVGAAQITGQAFEVETLWLSEYLL